MSIFSVKSDKIITKNRQKILVTEHVGLFVKEFVYLAADRTSM